MQQMAWREALDEARTATPVEALAAEVAAAERALLAELQRTLDEQRDAPGGGAAGPGADVRRARFRQDVDRRLEALGQ